MKDVALFLRQFVNKLFTSKGMLQFVCVCMYGNQFVEPTLHALNVFFTPYQYCNLFQQTTRAIVRESL
jgi:hypothetical protein